MNEWQKVRLADVCEYRNERTTVAELTLDNYISTENMLPDKAGITTSSGFPTMATTSAYRVGDVLVSNIRPYFKKIWFANTNGGCSNDVLVFRAKDKVYDSSFLYWVLMEDSFFEYSTSTAKGTKMPRGDKSAIMEYMVPYPPKSEQIAIADILFSIADKIEINNCINKNLEEMAQFLFKSWFVNFEPFQDEGFVDSELGQIPKGWKVGKIEDLGDVVGGSTPSKTHEEYYTTEGIAWITPKDLSDNGEKFFSKGAIDITELGLKNSSTKIMPKGTVLFSSRAPIGYITIAKNELTTNQGFKSITPKENIGTEYVYCFLKNNLDVIESRASGSTFKEVSGSVMKQIPALIPTDDVLSKFNEVCHAYFEQQEILEAQNRVLINMRDILLEKLISGEIRVPIEEVV